MSGCLFDLCHCFFKVSLCSVSFMKKISEIEGKPFPSSSKICPEACFRKGRGRANGAHVFCFLSSLPLLPPQPPRQCLDPTCHLSTHN